MLRCTLAAAKLRLPTGAMQDHPTSVLEAPEMQFMQKFFMAPKLLPRPDIATGSVSDVTARIDTSGGVASVVDTPDVTR